MTATTDYAIVTGNKIGINQAGHEVNELKSIVFCTDNTVDAGNTIAITLADYGITTVKGVYAWKETTDGSVIVTEADTTAVAAGILTVTIIAGTDNDPRTIQVFYV